MKKTFAVLLLSFVHIGAWAQQEEIDFTADRPGVSTGPSVVEHQVVQLEQGIQYDGDGSHLGTYTFSNTLLRYGLFPDMEIRLGGDAFLYPCSGGDISYTAAFSGITIGTKIKCFEGMGPIPAVSVLADFSIPRTASNGFNVDHLAPSLYLLFENPVCDWLSIGYNLGAEWDGTLPGATTFAALCLGFSATDSVGCFVESYNYFNKLGNAYYMDFGLNWQIGRKVQLDIAANMDLTNPAQRWAISCGVAWQINR